MPKDINDRVRFMHDFLCLQLYSVHIHEDMQDRTSVSPETAGLKILSDTLYNKIMWVNQTAQHMSLSQSKMKLASKAYATRV